LTSILFLPDFQMELGCNSQAHWQQELEQRIVTKTVLWLDHAVIPALWRPEIEESQVQGQPGIVSKTLSQKKRENHLSYIRGKDGEDHSSRPAWGKKSL
jgi:hypothetical protein